MRSPSIRMPWSAFGASDTPSMRRPARTRVRWGGAGWAAMPDPGSATATARPRARRVRHERGDIIPPGVSWEVRNVRRPILSAGLLVRQRARFRSLIVLALACWPAVMPAQAEPHRPALRAAADTNDWEACFDAGVAKLRREPAEAEAAFYWASRPPPPRAEPLSGAGRGGARAGGGARGGRGAVPRPAAPRPRPGRAALRPVGRVLDARPGAVDRLSARAEGCPPEAGGDPGRFIAVSGVSQEPLRAPGPERPALRSAPG